MKKVLMILALILPLTLMAQEVEVKESVGKKVVRTIQDAEWGKSKSAHQRDHDKKGCDCGGMRVRMGMQQANQERKKGQKKQHIRQVVRLAVVGGLAYYIGYHQGEEHFNGGWDRRKDWSDRK